MGNECQACENVEHRRDVYRQDNVHQAIDKEALYKMLIRDDQRQKGKENMVRPKRGISVMAQKETNLNRMLNSQNQQPFLDRALLEEQQRQQRSAYIPQTYQQQKDQEIYDSLPPRHNLQPVQQVNIQSARQMSTNKKNRQDPTLDSLDLPCASVHSAQPYHFKSGAVYTGSWLNQQREGFGVQVWPDGAKYEGYWSKNKAQGQGKFSHADGDVYEGEWVEDKAQGFGVYIHSDGTTFEGEWKADQQWGYGVEKWPDGSRYQGDYSNGVKHGQGSYRWADGSSYSGGWVDNKVQGWGQYSWPDGRLYEGQYYGGQMQGIGKYSWADGRQYVGQYQNDKKHGWGMYTWKDGTTYQGEWYQGKQHGRGRYQTQQTVRYGRWQDGQRQEWLVQGTEHQEIEAQVERCKKEVAQLLPTN